MALGRLVSAFLLTLAGAILAMQMLLHLAPGDPVDLVPGGEQVRSVLEAEWGLDTPLVARWGRYLARAATGDLGTSLTWRPGAPVAGLVLPATARSLGLALPAVGLALVLGTLLAWATAGRPSRRRRMVQVLSIAPVFLLAFVTVNVLNEAAWILLERGLIARPSWFALPDTESGVKTVLAIVVLAVGSGSLAEVHAAVEDEIVRIRNAPFVDAARARGAPLAPHVLRSLVPPLVTLTANRTAFFVGGLVVIEKILLLNGAGAMLWQACIARDAPLAMGLALVAAAVVCAARLLGDIVRLSVDPRLREPRP
ncbi:MAG: ABC transporter permease [Deltaproteobacteria bacterium]|nr:ABC transporter permease [Deltaproteobacteria bacterium]